MEGLACEASECITTISHCIEGWLVVDQSDFSCYTHPLYTQLVQHLHRELRERLEREIRQLQESLDREEEVAHFRELDAQQLRHKLSRVTFTTAVK